MTNKRRKKLERIINRSRASLNGCYEGMGETNFEPKVRAAYAKLDRMITHQMLKEAGLLRYSRRRRL